MKLSIAIFNGKRAESTLETDLFEAGVLFETTSYDDYYNSMELYGVDPDYRLSEEAFNIVKAAGFSILFVNHKDKWETHYDLSKTHKDGWRVSYPHKRNDGDSNIWLENDPPASWKNTFNVTIK